MVLTSFVFVAAANTLFNGNYQATRITIEGLDSAQGICYGSLLSSKPASGKWDLRDVESLEAPNEIVSAFKNYNDDDNYYFLGFLQDASDGAIYWATNPPEDFKVLLYIPSSDTFIATEPLTRYSLESPYKVAIQNGTDVNVTRDYDYTKMFLLLLARVAIALLITLPISFFFCKKQYLKKKYFVITNLLFHLILNAMTAWYSFKFGFTFIEHIGVMLWIYMLFALVQGFIYSRKVSDLKFPYYVSGISTIAVDGVFLLLVDVFPKLFNV